MCFLVVEELECTAESYIPRLCISSLMPTFGAVCRAMQVCRAE